MFSKSSRPMTLFEAVMWGTSKQVHNILDQRNLPIDDRWTDYALLLAALRRKRKDIVKILLKKGCRIKKVPRTDNSDTPLHYAVKLGDVEIISVLLYKGASVNDVDPNGETPLCLAMKKGNHEIVDLILSTNSIDELNSINSDGFSHFHIACIKNNVTVVESFLKHNVNVNDSVNFCAKEWSGYTPLHFAVNYECLDVLKLLLNHNADINVKNAEDMTPLHLAIQKQNEAIVNLLLSSHSDQISNPVDDNGLSHFHIACMKNHLKTIQKFLEHGIEINHAVNLNSPIWPGYTPLHFAVKGLSVSSTNQASIIELLLRYKADVNAKDAQGQTPLHLACLQSDEKISKLIQSVICTLKTDMETNKLSLCEKLSEIINQTEQTKVIELLLKYKSDVNVKNMFDESPIFYLYKNDRSKIVNKIKCDDHLLKHVIKEFNVKRKEILKILLNHNADVNVHNDMGQTILHLIAGINKEFDDEEKENTAELILSKGAKVDAKAKYGSTALHIAAKNGHSELIELLLKHHADVNAFEGSDQATPLHLATSYQQVKAINMLLKNQADVTAKKSNGMNVLHIMALMNPESSEEAEFIESYDKIIKTFVEQNCNINAQDINGRTPLHLASWDHNNAATWALLQHFADINVEDFGGETPLSFPMNSTERCVNIYCMFRDYINMLRLTGLYVSEKTSLCYLTLYGSSQPNPKDDFLLQCREEIERMKSIKINNYTSLFAIIFKNSNEIEVYAGNELFETILRSDDFEKNFNIYGNLLKSQFRKGLARKVLLKRAKDSLEFIIGLGLPDSCSEKIFQHLCDKSLSDLIKAKDLTVSNKKVNEQQTTYDQNECVSLEKAIAYCKKLFNKQMEMEIA